jgi:hypothetical protein
MLQNNLLVRLHGKASPKTLWAAHLAERYVQGASAQLERFNAALEEKQRERRPDLSLTHSVFTEAHLYLACVSMISKCLDAIFELNKSDSKLQELRQPLRPTYDYCSNARDYAEHVDERIKAGIALGQNIVFKNELKYVAVTRFYCKGEVFFKSPRPERVPITEVELNKVKDAYMRVVEVLESRPPFDPKYTEDQNKTYLISTTFVFDNVSDVDIAFVGDGSLRM